MKPVYNIKKILIFFFIYLIGNSAIQAQKTIIDNNTELLKEIENRYTAPCTKIEHRNWDKKRIRIDAELIKKLNKVYKMEFDYFRLTRWLEEIGYTKRKKLRVQEPLSDTTIFEKSNKGYLDHYISFVYNTRDSQLVKFQIFIFTKTHFICETKEWQSYSYIDFVYLRQFLKKIKIPLQTAQSNVELVSK